MGKLELFYDGVLSVEYSGRSGLREIAVDPQQGFLLLHSTGNYPAKDEIDVPINYADYYYLEALHRRASMK